MSRYSRTTLANSAMHRCLVCAVSRDAQPIGGYSRVACRRGRVLGRGRQVGQYAVAHSCSCSVGVGVQCLSRV